MNIIFKTIKIESFMSIGNIELNFTEGGYTLIQGRNDNQNDNAKSNGSGKSSIWEALVWCLTGETIRGSKDVENLYTKRGTLVSLEFTIDSHDYLLMRSKNHSEYKTNLQLFIDGENKSDKGIRGTEKILKEYLPDLNASLIGSVIVLGQGLPTRFTNNSPSGRKEVLEKLSKSDFMIDDLKNRIINRQSFLQTCLRNEEDKQLETKTKLSMNQNNIQQYENTLHSIESKETYEQLLKTQEQTLNYLNQEESTTKILLSTKEQEFSNLTMNLNNIFDQRNKCEIEIKNRYAEHLSELEHALREYEVSISALNSEIRSIESMKDTCPTCGQKLPNVFIPDVSNKKVELTNTLKTKETIQIEFNGLIQKRDTEISDTLSQYTITISETQQKQKDIQNELNTLRTTLSDINSNQLLTSKQINEYSTFIKSIDERITDYNNKIVRLNKEITVLQESLKESELTIENIKQKLEIIKKFDTIVKRDFRGYLLISVIDYINKKSKEYCELVFNNKYIDFRLNGNNISISYNQKEYEMLSGGEKQKIDLIIQFAIRDMLCEYLNFNSSILVLDEIFDNLDSVGCDKIVELISKKLTNINSIYIISHHADELNIPADRYITIIKDNNGISRLKQ